MTNYYRPSFATEENLFISTTRNQRPFIDAPMVPQPGLLPPHLRKLGSGPARWGNLIVGLGVENALRDGVTLPEIHAGFSRRRVGLNVDIIIGGNDAADEPIEYYGGVTLQDDILIIEGGTNATSSAMSFTRNEDGMYAPAATSGLVEGDELAMTDLTSPLSPLVEHTPAGAIPAEFKIAFEFSTLEETITACYDLGSVGVSGAIAFS
jgi:hypothetical protein